MFTNNTKKSERNLKKEKEILEKQKLLLEKKREIQLYFAWQKLPPLERVQIRQNWNKYYEKVKTTVSYKKFFDMKNYWGKSRMIRVKKLADKARKRLENQDWELARPQGVDPWEFSHGIYHKYDNICNKIRQINKHLTGVEDLGEIFE